MPILGAPDLAKTRQSRHKASTRECVVTEREPLRGERFPYDGLFCVKEALYP